MRYVGVILIGIFLWACNNESDGDTSGDTLDTKQDNTRMMDTGMNSVGDTASHERMPQKIDGTQPH